VGGPIVSLRDEAAWGKAAREAKAPGPSARHLPSSGAKRECVKGIEERRTTKRVETDDRASEHFVVPKKQGNPNLKETLRRKGNVVRWTR